MKLRAMSLQTFATFLLLSALATPTLARTAVCTNPIGRILGQAGTAMQRGQVIDEPDGMAGGTFTIIWENGQNQAKIVSQGSGGGEPLTDDAIQVFDDDEQVSFLVIYTSAVWLYSLFTKPKLLLITAHNNGVSVDTGGAIIKALKAKCEISE